MAERLNRKITPPVNMIDDIQFVPPFRKCINDIDIVLFNQGIQAYSFLQFVFPAGKIHSRHKLVPALTADLLLCGTTRYTSYEIAELLDFYGASVEPHCYEDETTIRVYCLSKHLQKVLELVKELFFDSVFPVAEAKIILNKWKQKQQINFKKPEYIASRLFKNTMFGNEHPYGELIEQYHFDELSIDDVVQFHQSNYASSLYKIIAAGHLPDDIEDLLGKFTENRKEKRHSIEPNKVVSLPHSERKHRVDLPDSVQCSIIIGRELFNMHHADYMDMYVLNSLLGGYFGSRLMSNLREDKGYTYGVHSTLYTRFYTGVFEISTEVNKEHVNEAIDEINKEIKRLQNEEVGLEELQIVKNYIIGHTLRGIDGPIKTAKLYKTLMIQDLDFGFSKQFENRIRTVQPQRLRELAIKYWQEEDLYQVVAG
jgi:predicted Zn-dependent peptidase